LLRGLAALRDGPILQVLVNRDTCLPADVQASERLRFGSAPWHPHGLANQFWLPSLLRRRGVRLFHSVDCFSPVAAFGTAVVVNVHDVVPLAFQDHLGRCKKARFPGIWRLWLKLQCARAARVVTVSNYSAHEIVSQLGVPREKIAVIYNPVREWKELAPADELRRRLGLDGRVVSYVGRQEPYKNVVSLVQAMRLVVGQAEDDKVKLVIAGAPDARYPDARREAARLGLADRVLFTGYLSEASLGALYQASDVFVFPSLYEGFGLPPLEAMRFGTPVVAGRRTAPPEVLGNAALTVDTEDPRAIADGILGILKDPDLARRLRQAGVQQAARYSRQRAAEQYLRLYEDVLRSSR
jgi:glycosyltransferase involved in cell wall biosynthesis